MTSSKSEHQLGCLDIALLSVDQLMYLLGPEDSIEVQPPPRNGQIISIRRWQSQRYELTLATAKAELVNDESCRETTVALMLKGSIAVLDLATSKGIVLTSPLAAVIAAYGAPSSSNITSVGERLPYRFEDRYQLILSHTAEGGTEAISILAPIAFDDDA
jgi:hypothetical protein